MTRIGSMSVLRPWPATCTSGLAPAIHFYLSCPLGKGSKNPGTETFREGGYPPISVNFFPLGFREPTVRGGGVPPPSGKNPLKIGQKRCFWAKDAVLLSGHPYWMSWDVPI